MASLAGLRPYVLGGVDRGFGSGLTFFFAAALLIGLALCSVALFIIALLFRGRGTKYNQRQNRKEHSKPCNVRFP